jgi:hypothetical protein
MLTQCKDKPVDSHFWSGLTSIKDFFYSCYKRVLEDGRKTRYWEDCWLGDRPLCNKFRRLYYLTSSPNITVNTFFFVNGFGCLKFMRFEREETLSTWNKLVDLCSQIQLSDEPDKFRWLLTSSGDFLVKSLYLMCHRYIESIFHIKCFGSWTYHCTLSFFIGW